MSSTSQRLGRFTSPIFKGETDSSHGGKVKAPVNFAQHSLLNGVDSRSRARVAETYGKLPLSFEANEGQFDSRVKFISRAGGGTLFLTATEAVLRKDSAVRPSRNHRAPSASPFVDGPARLESSVESAASVLRMKLVGANASAKVTGLGELPGKSNYFIGNDPQKWRVNVPNYAKVKYEQVYPGVDIVYYGKQRQLEYDLIVAPGADLQQIRLWFDGAQKVSVDDAGDLVLATAAGETRQHKPRVYQNVNGANKEFASRYVALGKNQFAFAVSAYDHGALLVIDPVLVYSTYLGGSSYDAARAIAVDAAGNAYVAGYTESSDFPIKNGLPAQVLNFVSEAFVTKLNPGGTALLYSTYLGGGDFDQANAIAVDSSGSVYTAGFSFSTDFPTVNPFQPVHGGGAEDAFVAKLSSSGDSLMFSTFLGGAGIDEARAIAVDSMGSAYLTGVTKSTNFPVANALQPTLSD
ncbi:MAG TPA: SBBP repeat-containing protein, partial [Blastocatellia bacterium]|nr:SBBP repeat-containing protein [Blastocatellia bacterium]